jgi:hypothetical protein
MWKRAGSVNTRLIEMYMRQRFDWMSEDKVPYESPKFIVYQQSTEDVAKIPDPYDSSITVH